LLPIFSSHLVVGEFQAVDALTNRIAEHAGKTRETTGIGHGHAGKTRLTTGVEWGLYDWGFKFNFLVKVIEKGIVQAADVC